MVLFTNAVGFMRPCSVGWSPQGLLEGGPQVGPGAFREARSLKRCLRASDEARKNQASKIIMKRTSVTEASWLVSVRSLLGLTGESRMLHGFRESPELQNGGMRALDDATLINRAENYSSPIYIYPAPESLRRGRKEPG